MTDETMRLLRDLIAIDSVNPSLVTGGAGEGHIAEAVASVLRALGLDVEVTEVEPGRPNVVGVLEGRRRGRSLILCGHLDTVGVAGMEAPFDPVERDGCLYGRGSQDMKGGLAAMIGAVRTVVRRGGLAAGRVILAALVDEEYASLGAEAFVRRWRADAALVGEPTDLIIGVGHKGFSWVEVTTWGRAAHGSRPEEGRDAILRMGRVLSRLEALDGQLSSRPPHPLLGRASLHASLITGGRELSTYPDRCTLQMERRTLTGEQGEIALQEVEEILAAIAREDTEFVAEARLLLARPAYETPPETPLPQMLETALVRHGRPPRRGAMTFWTDAAILGQAGIPSVVFGPGGAGLHGLQEYVRVEDVLTCQAVLGDLISLFCSQ